MENIKWLYFQFRKTHNYPVYLRFRQEELNPKYLHLLNELGFSELTDIETKKISLAKSHTRMLTVQGASARMQLQINGSDLLDKFGLESLTIQGSTPVYTYRTVGIMVSPQQKPLWDLALHHTISQTEQMIGLRIVLVRFLSLALADLGVLCYWGTVKDETVIVMKQNQSFGEAVIIDLNKRTIFSNGGEMRLGAHLKILRKDKDSKSHVVMSREELISFLSVSTCLMSFNGISTSMKRAVMSLSSISSAAYAPNEGSVNL